MRLAPRRPGQAANVQVKRSFQRSQSAIAGVLGRGRDHREPRGGDAGAAADPYWGMNVAAHAGEMRVNIGGDPGRDDYGLPPVDIEIPDDARELDRDVQAYRRELRALRWRRRTRWLVVPLGRDGMVLTLLTVFSGERMTPPSLGRSGHQLPNAIVLVAGTQEQLSSLRPSVLALVPPGCRCTHLGQLAAEANTAGVEIYIVGTRGVQA